MRLRYFDEQMSLFIEMLEEYNVGLGDKIDFRNGASIRGIRLRRKISEILRMLYDVQSMLAVLADNEEGVIWKEGRD